MYMVKLPEHIGLHDVDESLHPQINLLRSLVNDRKI